MVTQTANSIRGCLCVDLVSRNQNDKCLLRQGVNVLEADPALSIMNYVFTYHTYNTASKRNIYVLDYSLESAL